MQARKRLEEAIANDSRIHGLTDDLDTLFDFRNKAPGMPYAHPTVEHFAPLFVALGAATDPSAAPEFTIEGYWLGLAKRSFQVR